jgi:hypothetical protein
MNTKFFMTSIAVAISSTTLAQIPVILNPGSTTLNPVLSLLPNNGYNTVAVSTQDFTGVNALGQTAFIGLLDSFVFADTSGNLAFVYGVENDSSSMDAINHLSVTGYAGFQTYVAQVSLGTMPHPASYVASRSGNGDVVSFSFFPGAGGNFNEITPGSYSCLQCIFTTAKSFTSASAQISDGGIATVETFAPNAVPEPTSMVALGMGALGLLRRKRR